jgi:pimeloyl-ACP methyl ester carboxylesterase
MLETTPTVVLVHGAYADASSWNGVIERLQAQGVSVLAPANPLRGIAIDSAYISTLLDQIAGPVIAVGHSYAGAVITNAATDAKNVVGLVYVSAFAPEEGETLAAVEAGSKDSVLSGTALVARQYPTADGGSGTEFYINDRSPSRHLPSRTGHPPGRTGPPGQSWRPATRPQAPTSCARRRNVPAPRSQSSRAPT